MHLIRIRLKMNIVTFSSLLHAGAKTGDIAFAESVWNLMWQSQLQPNAITYNTMINICSKAQQPGRAQVWKALRGSSRVERLGGVAEVCGRTRLWTSVNAGLADHG